MKIITEPRVHLVSKQVFLAHPEYGIPDNGDEATRIGAFAARGCYDSYNGKGRPSNEDNQRNIIAHQHGSVLEHINAGLFIEGISRGISLELIRHRVGFAISQRSTRYVAEEDSAIVLEPYLADLYRKHEDVLGWGSGDEARTMIAYADNPEVELVAHHVNSCVFSILEYRNQVESLEELNPYGLTGFALRKWARGKARNVLPHALETRLTWTGNLRGIRHFIELRSDAAAEAEIRRLAVAVYRVMKENFPLYFEDYVEEEGPEGIPVLKTVNRKV